MHTASLQHDGNDVDDVDDVDDGDGVNNVKDVDDVNAVDTPSDVPRLKDQETDPMMSPGQAA